VRGAGGVRARGSGAGRGAGAGAAACAGAQPSAAARRGAASAGRREAVKGGVSVCAPEQRGGGVSRLLCYPRPCSLLSFSGVRIGGRLRRWWRKRRTVFRKAATRGGRSHRSWAPRPDGQAGQLDRWAGRGKRVLVCASLRSRFFFFFFVVKFESFRLFINF